MTFRSSGRETMWKIAPGRTKYKSHSSFDFLILDSTETLTYSSFKPAHTSFLWSLNRLRRHYTQCLGIGTCLPSGLPQVVVLNAGYMVKETAVEGKDEVHSPPDQGIAEEEKGIDQRDVADEVYLLR